MKRKGTLIVVAAVALCFGSLANAQTRSEQIPGLRKYEVDLKVMPESEKDSIRMVSELWKSYVSSFINPLIGESQRRAMWVDGSEDYLIEFDDGNMLYSTFRENRILDIRKINGGTYEIVALTRSKIPGEAYENWVESVYRLCAMSVAKKEKGKNPFRLCNYLDAVVPTLKKTAAGYVDFFCDPAVTVPKSTLSTVSSFVEEFRNAYRIKDRSRITYVVGRSVDDCQRMSGFLFNVYSNPLMESNGLKSSSSRFFGKAYSPNMVLSNYYDDCHDIILNYIRADYPDALPYIQEGVAMYHGGYMDHDWETLKSGLRKFIRDNEEIDFADDMNLEETAVLVGATDSEQGVLVPLQALAGAAIVGYVYEKDGSSKVRDILDCKTYKEVFETLGLSEVEINGFFRKNI